jgi:hypothetical protein
LLANNKKDKGEKESVFVVRLKAIYEKSLHWALAKQR